MFKVYKITNLINNKIYIGYTHLDLEHRFRLHVTSGSKKMVIYNAIEKYGKENFKIEIVECFDSKKEAVEKEILLIEQLKPEYNIHFGGTGGPMFGKMNGMYGKKHTEQWKKMMSDKMSGSSNPMYGKSHSEEVKKIISDKTKGRVPWNKNKTNIFSEEVLQKLKKPKTDEHKQKLRKKYIIDGNYVDNIKKWCDDNGHNYIVATQAAKNRKTYKGHDIRVIE